MTPEKQARLQVCLQEVASILYEETNSAELINLESIEKTALLNLSVGGTIILPKWQAYVSKILWQDYASNF